VKKPIIIGKYKPIDRHGNRVDGPNITIDGDEGHMPPTRAPNQFWQLIVK